MRKAASSQDSPIRALALISDLGTPLIMGSVVFGFLLALLLGFSLSRTLAASLISALPYVGDENNSKSNSVVQSQTRQDILILILFGAMPLFLFSLTISN